MIGEAPLQRVEDLLSADAFAEVLRITRPRRGKHDVYGNLQEKPFLRPILTAVREAFPEVSDKRMQQVLLRFEGRTGLLHHDQNHRPDRTHSLLYYVDQPERGGEVVFPFFDASGLPTENPVTRACRVLSARDKLYAEDPALEAWIVAHRDTLLTVTPRANSVLLFPSAHEPMWHYVCPVEAGHRSCVVIFFHKKG